MPAQAYRLEAGHKRNLQIVDVTAAAIVAIVTKVLVLVDRLTKVRGPKDVNEDVNLQSLVRIQG